MKINEREQNTNPCEKGQIWLRLNTDKMEFRNSEEEEK